MGKKQSKYGDLSGQKFGRLTVVERGEDLNGSIHWWCECDCGNKVLVDQYNLIYGTTKSCGCIRRQAAKQKIKEIKRQNEPKDLTGERFGKLTVLKRADDYDKNNHIRRKWLCRCDCGKEKIVSQYCLEQGNTKSCGCLFEQHKNRFGKENLHDLTGQKIGSWTVLERGENKNQGDGKSPITMWICKCDCGTIKSVSAQSLVTGRSKSCGCAKSKLISESRAKRRGDKPIKEPGKGKDSKRIREKEWPDNLILTIFGTNEITIDINFAMGIISERERDIVRKYYKLHLTQEKISQDEGCSRERIRQILGRAKRKIRNLCFETCLNKNLAEAEYKNLVEIDGKTQDIKDWANELGMKERKLLVYLRFYGEKKSVILDNGLETSVWCAQNPLSNVKYREDIHRLRKEKSRSASTKYRKARKGQNNDEKMEIKNELINAQYSKFGSYAFTEEGIVLK